MFLVRWAFRDRGASSSQRVISFRREKEAIRSSPGMLELHIERSFTHISTMRIRLVLRKLGDCGCHHLGSLRATVSTL